MPLFGPIEVSQKLVKAYYEALASFANQKVKHETAIRAAFQTLLSETFRKRGWTLIPELASTGRGNTRVVPDGALRDEFLIPRGYWEAKDLGRRTKLKETV